MSEATGLSSTSDVLAIIDESREDLADLALLLGNTYGPFGHEAPTAHVVDDWYRKNELQSELVPITNERCNVVARVGSQPPALLFNAHLDTEASGDEFDVLFGAALDPNKVGAWREGDRLFGHTVLNDRGCMAAFMIAARAIAGAKCELQRGVLFASVAGETGAAPVDEYRGIGYEGKGLGSSYLLRHGIRAEYALVAETTDFGVCWSNLGAAYFKVVLRGRNMYTPRLVRPVGVGVAGHPNAIVKAGVLVGHLESWAIEREDALAHLGPCGEVRPRSQIGAIRGGLPWRPNRSAPMCALYIDVRLLPGEDPAAIGASLRQVIDRVDPEAELSLIMAKDGATGVGVEPLVSAIRRSHEAVRGLPLPPAVEVGVASMWRDNNIYNRAGIPSLTFGPSRGDASVQGTGCFDLQDLVDASKIYALTAIDVANRPLV